MLLLHPLHGDVSHPLHAMHTLRITARERNDGFQQHDSRSLLTRFSDLHSLLSHHCLRQLGGIPIHHGNKTQIPNRLGRIHGDGEELRFLGLQHLNQTLEERVVSFDLGVRKVLGQHLSIRSEAVSTRYVC